MSNNHYLDPELLAMQQLWEQNKEKRKKLIDIAENLNLKFSFDDRNAPMISIENLWEILSDESKLKDLLSRVKLKAFW